jgi:hypothetical protein
MTICLNTERFSAICFNLKHGWDMQGSFSEEQQIRIQKGNILSQTCNCQLCSQILIYMFLKNRERLERSIPAGLYKKISIIGPRVQSLFVTTMLNKKVDFKPRDWKVRMGQSKEKFEETSAPF